METIALDGEWLYRQDSEDEGLENLCFAEDANTSGWQSMKLPANWQIAGLHNTDGVVWFRRAVELTEVTEQESLWLRFEGVDYFARVWLNGEELGEHEGYFEPFEFEITDFARRGQNEIVVRVDSPLEEPGKAWPNAKRLIKGVFSHHDGRPGGWSNSNGQDGNTGGIWAPVTLEYRSKTHFEEVLIRTELPALDRGALKVNLSLFGEDDEELEAQILMKPENFDGEPRKWTYPVKADSEDRKLAINIPISEPELWDVWEGGEPNLYRVTCVLRKEDEVLDRTSRVVGFRSLKIDDKWRWQLNGRRFFPRGTNFVPTQWLSEYTQNLIDRDIQLLLYANVNAIRITGHVNRKELLEACDRAGILVWQDFPLQWGVSGESKFHSEACRQMRAMVRQLAHHPCIALWCCHNEPTGEKVHELDNALAGAAGIEDPNRKIVVASMPSEHAFNGWYIDDYTDYDKLPGAPMVSEFGAQGLPAPESLNEMFQNASLVWPPQWDEWAYRNFQYDQTFNVARIEQGKSLEEFAANSQQYQAVLLKYAIEHYRLAKHRAVHGIFQFCFVDCWPSIGYSVIDYFRRPKLAFKALQVAYQPILPVFIFSRRATYSGAKVSGRLAIINDLPHALENAKAEITLEVEKGTLITWMADLITVPASDAIGQAIEEITDDFRLPSNMTLGTGRFVIRILDEDGRRIAENVDALEVVEPPPV